MAVIYKVYSLPSYGQSLSFFKKKNDFFLSNQIVLHPTYNERKPFIFWIAICIFGHSVYMSHSFLSSFHFIGTHVYCIETTQPFYQIGLPAFPQLSCYNQDDLVRNPIYIFLLLDTFISTCMLGAGTQIKDSGWFHLHLIV